MKYLLYGQCGKWIKIQTMVRTILAASVYCSGHSGPTDRVLPQLWDRLFTTTAFY